MLTTSHLQAPSALSRLMAVAISLAGMGAGAFAFAGPTEDALKVGEEALAKGDLTSASVTWINAYNERAEAKTANDETCAQLLRNAGKLFASAGNVAGAVECFEKLYSLRVELNGPASPETAIAASILAANLTRHGTDLDRAERLAREAEEILAKAGDAYRVERFTAMGNIGGVLAAKKDRLAANQQFIQCLKFAEEKGEPPIPEDLVAGCYEGLSMIAAFFGRNADKQRYLQRSIELRTRASGKHAPSVYRVRLEWAAGQPGDQQGAAYEAIVTDLYSAPNSDTDAALQQIWAAAEYKLAIIESQRSDRKRVASLIESAIKHGAKGFGELHGELLPMYLDLAKVHLMRNEYDKGVACYRQVLAIRKKHLGEDHESVRETQKLLDGLLADLAKVKAR